MTWDLQVTNERGAQLPAGLQSLAKGLRDSGDRYLAVEIRNGTKDNAGRVRTLARATLAAAPGRYPKSRTQLAARFDTVLLSAPWAPGAEWGSNTHPVFGVQRRDVWGIWPARVTPGPDSGYVLGAAYRIAKAQNLKRARDAGRDAVRTGMASVGIPRSGGTG